MKRTSAYWQFLYPEITVLDPDGWDRTNFQQSWNEEITLEEYTDRVKHSTCQFKKDSQVFITGGLLQFPERDTVHIKSVTVTEDEMPFLKETKITFSKNITIITGDQGSGKSTILNWMKYGGPIQINGKPNRIALLCGEKNNPRFDNSSYQNPLDKLVGNTIKSHGEVSLPLFMQFIEMAKPGDLLLLDEPDAGLSFRSTEKMFNAIKEKTKDQVQFIIASHNLYLMKLVGEVFNMETLTTENTEDIEVSLTLDAGFVALNKRKEIISHKMALLKCQRGSNCICANTTRFYNNQCIDYIGRDGKPNSERIIAKDDPGAPNFFNPDEFFNHDNKS